MIAPVNTSQNATLLEISCHGSYGLFIFPALLLLFMTASRQAISLKVTGKRV